MMKYYKCTVLNRSWQQCAGTFSASDENEAKQKLFSYGYSIIQLREIPQSEVIDPVDFFHRPHALPKENEARKEMVENAAKSEIRRQVSSKDQKRGIVILCILILIVLGLGITAFFSLNPPRKTEPLSARNIVRSYLTLGFRGNWHEQYKLLSLKRTASYLTPENYARQMEQNWLGLPTLQTNGSNRSNTVREVPPSEVVDLVSLGTHNLVAANILISSEKRRLVFLLRLEGKELKIDYIRDLEKVDTAVRLLARNNQSSRRDAIISELQQDFGYTTQEITELIKHYHMHNVLRDLRKSMEDNIPGPAQNVLLETADVKLPPEPHPKETAAAQEAIEVASQLQTLLDLVDGMKEEPPKLRS